MVIGIIMLLLGIGVILFMHKEFLLEHEISKFIVKKHRIWQGRLLGTALILIGVTKIVAAAQG